MKEISEFFYKIFILSLVLFIGAILADGSDGLIGLSFIIMVVSAGLGSKFEEWAKPTYEHVGNVSVYRKKNR